MGICLSGSRDDRAAGRPAPPAGPGALPPGRPSSPVQAAPPEYKGVSGEPRTAVKRNNWRRSGVAGSHRVGPWRTEVPPAAPGHAGAMGLWRVDYVAMRPVAGNMATGTPAGGLWAWAGQIRKWNRIFSMTSGYWTGIDTDGAALAPGPDVGCHEHQPQAGEPLRPRPRRGDAKCRPRRRTGRPLQRHHGPRRGARPPHLGTHRGRRRSPRRQRRGSVLGAAVHAAI